MTFDIQLKPIAMVKQPLKVGQEHEEVGLQAVEIRRAVGRPDKARRLWMRAPQEPGGIDEGQPGSPTQLQPMIPMTKVDERSGLSLASMFIESGARCVTRA